MMKKIILLLGACYLLSCSLVYANTFGNRDTVDAGWKAGVARVMITPQQSMWMAGYAARDRPSEGTMHDLWAKALAFEDAEGRQSVLVTTDLLGLPKDLSDNIRKRLEAEYGLSDAQVILNSSHTHSGPVLENALVDIYPLNPEQQEQIEQYTTQLEDQIVALVGESLDSLQTTEIFAANGTARFQVNRRNNDAATLERQTELNGPNDYAVPVIKVMDEAGELMAIAFGYACHPTVLSEYDWSGDYAGFAQLELEEAYPGVTALFFQGAGADQNPLPRRSEALAQQYGRTLAAAVDRVLNEDMRSLSPSLTTAYTEVDLQLTAPPAREELVEMKDETSGYQKRWADRMLRKIEQGDSFMESYPYPVQIWQLDDQMMVSLGGELVIDYAIELKRMFGQELFVLGYSNDVMAYIPSTRILMEGGYEGETSQMVYGLPSVWKADIQTRILYEVVQLAKEAGISPPD